MVPNYIYVKPTISSFSSQVKVFKTPPSEILITSEKPFKDTGCYCSLLRLNFPIIVYTVV